MELLPELVKGFDPFYTESVAGIGLVSYPRMNPLVYVKIDVLRLPEIQGYGYLVEQFSMCAIFSS